MTAPVSRREVQTMRAMTHRFILGTALLLVPGLPLMAAGGRQAGNRQSRGLAQDDSGLRVWRWSRPGGGYSTVTDFARLRGWSTSVPLSTAT